MPEKLRGDYPGAMRGLGILAAGAAVLALATSGPVAAESVVVGSEAPLAAELTISPKALPKREPGPAALAFGLRLKPTLDGRVDTVKEITIDLDRNVVLDFAGYPVCSPGPQSQSLPEPPLSDECMAAIVGRGSASFELRLLDLAPVAVSSRLILINSGRRNGGLVLSALAEITVPVPTRVVMTIEVRPNRVGRYGTTATIALPKVAGGAGALTGLRFRISKRFLHGEQRKSLVRARCPDGKLQTEVEAVFADDSSFGETLARPCTPRHG